MYSFGRQLWVRRGSPDLAVTGNTIMDSRLLWGAVEMLILEVISHGPTYGYEIAQTVTSESNGYFDLKEGSLYPALHRLEQQKLLTAFWQEVDAATPR